MSKGLGKLQQKAREMSADGITLVSPLWLACEFFGETPSDAQIRSARRALQTLARRGLITDHGFSGGTGHKIYGGKQAARVNLERAYARAMSEFAESMRHEQV